MISMNKIVKNGTCWPHVGRFQNSWVYLKFGSMVQKLLNIEVLLPKIFLRE